MSTAKKISDLELSGPLESQVLEKISSKVTAITGVQLGKKQENMVITRLSRRTSELGLTSLTDYFSYFEKNESQEINSLISLLTTHHTFFFREFSQLELLREQLPTIIQELKAKNRHCIEIWCAACSTGQEVYTIAMFLKLHLPTIDPKISFKILASDVDPKSVQRAENGVYRWTDLQKAPQIYLKGNWLKGTGEIADFVKVQKSLKDHCEFTVSNITRFDNELGSRKFDLIFCRNVFIYFTQEQVSSTVNNFQAHLHPNGHILTGLSESLTDPNFKGTHLGRSIYKIGDDSEKITENDTKVIPIQTDMRTERNLRVLCVDDSPTVHTIMKKILSPEYGFEIVGTAKNGLEAQTLLKSTDFDVMALDIHMPEMNGIEYLQSSWTEQHPPVVMVSSVSATDSDLAMRALDSGAFDYVEKPNLQTFNQCADEIRSKLKAAVQFKELHSNEDKQLTKDFSEKLTVSYPEKKCRYLFCRTSEIKKVKKVLSEGGLNQPPTVVIFESPKNMLPGIEKELKKVISNEMVVLSDETKISGAGSIFLGNIQSIDPLLEHLSTFEKNTSNIMFLGDLTESLVQQILANNKSYIINEDLGEYKSSGYQAILNAAHCTVPFSSFAYESDKNLSSNGQA